MSDLHLELFFPRSGSIGVQPGYAVFECIPSARVLALLGDIGLAAHGGLYDFLERQLHKYRHILYVIGNHEGHQSTYVSASSLIIRVISDFLSCWATGSCQGWATRFCQSNTCTKVIRSDPGNIRSSWSNPFWSDGQRYRAWLYSLVRNPSGIFGGNRSRFTWLQSCSELDSTRLHYFSCPRSRMAHQWMCCY